jgi:putative DNA primase/helicase
MASLLHQSKGKWKSLLTEILELDPEILDGNHRPCPACGGVDRFRFDDLEGRGTYYCAGCGAGAGLSLICKVKGITSGAAWNLVKAALPEATETETKPKEDYRPFIKRVLAKAVVIAPGDSIYQYLTSRGIFEPPKTILRAPTIFPKETDPWMMVCRVVKGNRLAGIHLTLLKDGKRHQRLMYGLSEGSLKGGAIRLHPLESRGIVGELVVGEGVETSLSAAQYFDRPAWSCMNAVLLEQVEIPNIVTDLMIAGDNDATYTGQRAAFVRANKSVVVEHRKTTVMIPEKVGADWNSVAS